MAHSTLDRKDRTVLKSASSDDRIVGLIAAVHESVHGT
jgi:hypothetical protein